MTNEVGKKSRIPRPPMRRIARIVVRLWTQVSGFAVVTACAGFVSGALSKLLRSSVSFSDKDTPKPSEPQPSRRDIRRRVSLRRGLPSRFSVIGRGFAIGSEHLFGVHQGLSGHDRRCRMQWRSWGPGERASRVIVKRSPKAASP